MIRSRGSAATIVWLRVDLRLADQPALAAAVARGGPVIPLFVWAPEEEGDWPPGAASRYWLHHSLRALDQALRERGSRLLLRRGPSVEALLEIARDTGATGVVWSRRYEPAIAARDARVAEALSRAGLSVETFESGLLWPPEALGRRYQVFTPYWRACAVLPPPAAPLPAPRLLSSPRRWPPSLPLAALALEPRIDWAAGIRAAWTPGEAGARGRLRAFIRRLSAYAEARDRADEDGTSRLSPHLHFGEISPRTVWRAVAGRPGADAYLRQLGWREFAHHLLVHFPHTPTAPLRPAFAAMPWARHPGHLRAWQRGRTGYPLVDAGMRQLWTTGWMHNRVRMVVASFLVKHLLLPWQEGARWFWDTLVDANLANNTLGWQWVAGSGADAAPYFRIFNPGAQAERHDPRSAYRRRWVPDLDQPSYPGPIVDHREARTRALRAYDEVKRHSRASR